MDAVEQQDYDFPDISFESILNETETHTLFNINGRACWIKISEYDDLDTKKKVFNIPRKLAIELELIED